MIKYLLNGLIGVVFLWFNATTGFAKNPFQNQNKEIDSLRVYEVEPIEILEKKTNDEVKSLYPVQKFDQKEIEELSVINVAEAVKYMPGVMLKDYGGIGGLKTISVRSLSASHTAVFIDGIKYSNTQIGQIDLGRFSTDRISKIEVLSSGISADLNLPAQAYLTTSSLYLQTQGAKLSGLNQTLTVDSKLSFGSFGYQKIQLGSKWKASKALMLSLSADQMDAHGEYGYYFQNGSVLENHRRKNTDVRATSFESDLRLSVSDQSTLNVKGYGYFSERGLPGSKIANNDIPSQERLWNHDAFLQSTWMSKAFNTLDYVLRAKYSYNFTRYLNPAHYSGDIIHNRYTEHEGYSSINLNYHINPYLSLSSSTDLAWSTLFSERFDHPERLSLLTVLAVKTYYGDVELNANILWSNIDEKGFSEFYDKAIDLKRNDVLPTFSLGYWIFNELHASVSFKKSLRLPSFNEMYYPTFGNTDLRPEYTTQYNLGLGYQNGFKGIIESVSMKIDVFRLNIRDKIIAIPRGAFNWSVVNKNRVETTGIELNGEIKIDVNRSFKLAVSGGFTYQEALEKTPSTALFYQASTYGKQIAYTPKVTSSMIASLYYDELSLSWQMAYVGSRYISGEQIIQNHMPQYSTHDFNVIYHFKLFSIKSSIKGELNNAFDKRYEVIKNYPMSGRSFRISLSVHS